jgi:GNAT superfamily N-acetyltransferase
MISELREEDYEMVRPLYRELEYNLTTMAVIDKTSPGRIFVDDPLDPRTAFMCTVEGYYLAGAEDNDDFNTSLNELIFSMFAAGDTVRKAETVIAVSFHPESWEAKMPVILHGRSPLIAARRHYVCTRLGVDDWESRIPDGFSIRHIDERLLSEPVDVPDHLTGWMQANWGSVPCFLERGFGCCMLHGRQIISWSVADCIGGNACEIGIRTREDYRRRGLGTLTAAAAVELALSKYGSVGWHCDEKNTPSIRVAEKVGFDLERRYIQYYACLSEDP